MTDNEIEPLAPIATWWESVKFKIRWKIMLKLKFKYRRLVSNECQNSMLVNFSNRKFVLFCELGRWHIGKHKHSFPLTVRFAEEEQARAEGKIKVFYHVAFTEKFDILERDQQTFRERKK